MGYEISLIAHFCLCTRYVLTSGKRISTLSSVNILRKRYGHYGDERLKKAVKLFDTNSTKLPQQDVN